VDVPEFAFDIYCTYLKCRILFRSPPRTRFISQQPAGGFTSTVI